MGWNIGNLIQIYLFLLFTVLCPSQDLVKLYGICMWMTIEFQQKTRTNHTSWRVFSTSFNNNYLKLYDVPQNISVDGSMMLFKGWWWWIALAEWLTEKRCLSLPSSHDHYQKLLEISHRPWAKFETVQSLSWL